MHVTTKDASQDGKTHTLTSVIEADGPFELVRADQFLSGNVVSVERTASGGIVATTEIYITAAKPSPPLLPAPTDVELLEEEAEEGASD